MSKKHKGNIVKEAIRRFPQLGNRTIANHILVTHGPLFNNDLEAIRSSVRYYTGKNGEKNRGRADDSLFRDTPIPMPQTWRKKRTDYNLDPGLWLILSDIHVPFHEPLPLEAAIQAGKVESVDGLLLNGDILDCASVGFWPQAHRDTNGELIMGLDMLDLLRQEFPTQRIVFKPGNHEERLRNYFISKAPDLAETPWAAMDEIMGFEYRKIECLDYCQKVIAGKLPIIHGHEVPYITKAVNAARGLFNRAKTYCACSHCHSTSEHTPRDINGEILTTWSFGCLCDLNPDYNPFGNDWNWGFGLVNIEKDGDFEVINRRILPKGKVV